MVWRDHNLGKSPFDPDYDDGYDPDEDRERYELEQEMKQKARDYYTDALVRYPNYNVELLKGE